VTRAALIFCGLVLGYVGGGVAEGLTRCPTWDECLTMEALCERPPARNWKPCRREVAACFRRADYCYGGWAY